MKLQRQGKDGKYLQNEIAQQIVKVFADRKLS